MRKRADHDIVSDFCLTSHIGKMPDLYVLAYLGVPGNKICYTLGSDIAAQCFRDAMDCLAL